MTKKSKPKGEAPKMIRDYRTYRIKLDAGKYVAKPLDGDDLRIVSRDLPRLQSGIDAFHTAAEQYPAATLDQIIAPRWTREWLANPTSVIDVDDAYRRGAC
jgi:hypothetical protein